MLRVSPFFGRLFLIRISDVLSWFLAVTGMLAFTARLFGQCQPVEIGIGANTFFVEGGVRLVVTVNLSSGTLPVNYHLSFRGFSTNISASFKTSETVSLLFGPFDNLPDSFTASATNSCSQIEVSIAAGPVCGPICLAAGIPSTRTGTEGAGIGPVLTNGCGGIFGTNSKWFRMTTSINAHGLATISTEGSDYDTAMGVFRGSVSSPGNLVPVACNNDISAANKQSRIQFEVVPNTNYWMVVNATNGGTLKLSYGYDPKLSIAYIKSNKTVGLLSSSALSLRYNLLASTNLSTNPAAWSVIFSTNFMTNTSATTNILRFVEANPFVFNRRFYRIALVP